MMSLPHTAPKLEEQAILISTSLHQLQIKKLQHTTTICQAICHLAIGMGTAWKNLWPSSDHQRWGVFGLAWVGAANASWKYRLTLRTLWDYLWLFGKICSVYHCVSVPGPQAVACLVLQENIGMSHQMTAVLAEQGWTAGCTGQNRQLPVSQTWKAPIDRNRPPEWGWPWLVSWFHSDEHVISFYHILSWALKIAHASGHGCDCRTDALWCHSYSSQCGT